MPYTRRGKCVYKKNPDGSRGEKVGCSDSEEGAKQYMKKLYSLDETDSELLDEDIVGRGEMRNVRLFRQLIRELLEEPIQEPVVNPAKGVADELSALILQGSRFKLGGRKDRVQRIYPVKPIGKPENKATNEDFKDAIQTFVIPGNPSGKYEVVPPNSSRLGFYNGSSKFNLFLVVPGGGKITHSKYREGDYIPIMLAGGPGANTGQKYENKMVQTLQSLATGEYFPGEGSESTDYAYGILDMLTSVGLSLEKLKGANVKKTTPQKRQLRSVPYDVGPQIADIIITPKGGSPAYLSVKSVDGKTFGNHGYAGGFVLKKSIDGSEKIVPGPGGPGDTEDLIAALGIDKTRVARGLTDYHNETPSTPEEDRSLAIDPEVIQSWLASGIGFGYYYVKEIAGTGSIKAIHLRNAADAMDFIGAVKRVSLLYPRYKVPGRRNSKQLTANVWTTNGKFLIEIRNTSRWIVPKQINFRVENLKPPEGMVETRKLIRQLIREVFLSDRLSKSRRRSFIDLGSI